MITKKRGIALMLSIVMSAGLFAGCGRNDSSSAGGKKTLTVAVFDRGNAPSNGETPDNNRWTKWINEKFGEENNIEVKFDLLSGVNNAVLEYTTYTCNVKLALEGLGGAAEDEGEFAFTMTINGKGTEVSA